MGTGTGRPATYTTVGSFARPYASVLDVIDDLEVDGVRSIDRLYRAIMAASNLIDKRGHFIPLSETRNMDGTGWPTLWIDPILEVTALTLNGVALDADDYVLLPRARMWEHGPYTSIELTNLGIWPNSQHDQIEISGKWGLYDDAIDLTVTASQSNSATTLTVSSAAEVSPGMVALLGSEQELIEDYAAPVSASLTLDEALTSDADTLTLNTSSAVAIGEIIRIDVEKMRVLDVNNKLVAVSRGWGVTTRSAHDDNTAVECYRAFKVRRAINGTAAATHSTVNVWRCLPPYNVRYLCEQIAALMYRKGQAGFAAKTGNVEMGEVFYHNEFPDDPIETVMRDYRIVTV